VPRTFKTFTRIYWRDRKTNAPKSVTPHDDWLNSADDQTTNNRFNCVLQLTRN